MMDHDSDRMSGLKPRDASLAPLAVLGAVAATAGLTAYLTWPAQRSASTRQRRALIAYLRDHLSGADVAIRVVHRLGSTNRGTEDGTLFRRLSKEFEEDHSVVRTLLTHLGASGRSIKRAAGFASGAVLSVPAGGEPGDLSLLRTLEALAIGVQGKRCMWRALQNLRTVPSSVDGMTFAELEAKAIRQWEAIEERRRALVAQTSFGSRGTAISGACGTSPSSATVRPAECDVRTPVAIHPSSGTPIDGPAQSRVSSIDDGDVGAEGERYGRNFIRQADKSEIPATMSYWGASRCQPMGVPGRYSLIRAMANASASMPAQWAICARRGNRNAGSGPAAVRSYDWPKNATRRRATTPRISKSANATSAIASRSDSLIAVGDEVLAIVEAPGPIAFEEISRRHHHPSLSRLSSQLTRAATPVRRTVLAVSRLAEPAVSDEVVQDDLARSLAEAEEPRGLWQVQREARHLGVGAKDQSHELGARRLAMHAASRRTPPFAPLRVPGRRVVSGLLRFEMLTHGTGSSEARAADSTLVERGSPT